MTTSIHLHIQLSGQAQSDAYETAALVSLPFGPLKIPYFMPAVKPLNDSKKGSAVSAVSAVSDVWKFCIHSVSSALHFALSG